MREGIRYLERNYRRDSNYPHYGHYYCAQAMFQVGGRLWREYFEFASELIIRTQRDGGDWGVGSAEKSRAARTAMSLIVLQLPYRFLPIHER